MENKRKLNKKFNLILIILLLFLIFSIILGVTFGSSYIDIKTVYKFLINKILGKNVFSPNWENTVEIIIWEIRTPRIFLSAICGAGLALCGILMQCITKNPVADPYILGISSGASTGAVLMIIMGKKFSSIIGITGGAFIGAIICGTFVFIVGTEFGKNLSTIRLILTGLATSTIFSSITNLLIYSARNPNQVRSAIFWSMGSMGRARWDELIIPLIIIIIGIIFSLFLSKSLDILLLGDNTAKMLGMNISIIKSVIIIVATLITAVLVAITGSIGFIGLVVPHICRIFCGSSHKQLILITIIVGASFLIWCDIIARCFVPPKEIPIGIITSILGGPFFLFLIGKKRTLGGNE